MWRNKSEALLDDAGALPSAVYETNADPDRPVAVASTKAYSPLSSRNAVPTADVHSLAGAETHVGPSYTFEQAIEEIGIGKLQWRLLLICGGWWGCDAIEIMLLSFLLPTLVTEWDLSPFMSALVASATFFGAFCGTFVWVFGLASAFSPNLPTLIILRGLLGVGIGGTPVAFSMFSEFLPVKNRGRILVAFEVLWTVGILFEACLAWILLPRVGWRWLIAISSVPLWLMLFCYPLVPESPRFLMIAGRGAEAEQVLERIARINGKRLPAGKLSIRDAKEERGKLLDLVQVPSLRVLSILLWVLWFVNSIAYYGNVLFTPEYFGKTLQQGQENDTSLVYILTLVTTLSEFPGLAVSAFFIDYIGRKKTMAFCLLGCGFCTFFLMFHPPVVVGVALLSGGRLCVEASYAALWTYTPEAYPTTIRATGLGVANGWSKIASIITPFISASILSTTVTVPVLIFSGFAVLGCVIALLLPIETKGRRMSDTITPTQPEGDLGLEIDTSNQSHELSVNSELSNLDISRAKT